MTKFTSIGRGVYKYNPKTNEYDWQYNCARTCEATGEVEMLSRQGRHHGNYRERIDQKA